MDFDTLTDRNAAYASKWLRMEVGSGCSAEDGLPMWVADMDFRSPDCAHRAAEDVIANSAYGYFHRMPAFHDAIGWWMRERHGWEIEPDWILTTHGLGNAIGILLQTLSEPGEGIITFNPVYHEFANKIGKNKRRVVESPLVVEDGVYHMDLDALEASLSGDEKIVLFCSPHNPAGRIWNVAEQRALAAFCEKHDLWLVSDEIHQDLVFPGHTHVPMAVAAPEVADRLIVLTAASKTFNIAGLRTGNIIVPDPALRKRIASAVAALDIQPNVFGVAVSTAVYSPDGAAWVDALVEYIAENHRVFSEGVGSIPGVSVMPQASTFLSWVDFSGTGMDRDEIHRRVTQDARLGPSPGPAFGAGGELCKRFNIGTQRARIDTAVERLRAAFADLQ